MDDPAAANPIATPIATTEYTVEVTDASGAKATDKIVVTADPCAVVVFPAPNALNVNKAVNLAFTFANPVDPATLTNGTIRVNGSQSGLHTSSNITYDSGTRKATFDPASDFKSGEVVNVTLVFAKVGNIAVGSSPISTTAGDFDGDRDLDLAVANRGSGSVSILKNNGSGVFTPSSTPSVKSQPYFVTTSDFDGDGDWDLAVANYDSNGVSILKNNGSGAFAASAFVRGLNRPYSVTAGDFDGDGDMDLAVVNWNSGNVSILKNDGNGAFAPNSTVGVGTNPANVIAGDFDGDRDLDLAVANHSSNDVSILKNNGSGAFTPITVGVGSDPHSIAVSDFDGDGDLDLAVTNYSSNNVSILKNGLLAEAGSNTEICSGQSVTLGGNPTAINGAPPYTYKWTPTAGLDDPAAANPIAKPTATTIYTVEATDAKGGKATDQVTIIIPMTGWSVAHIVDVDDVIFGINQGAITGGTPRDNRGLALSPNKRFLYLGYNTPSNNRVVRKIDLSISDPANNHSAVVAQLILPAGTQPARDIATDDRGRVYLALGTKIEVYNANLQTPPLHTISGFTACEGVSARRENGILIVYATDRLDKTLERFVLVEGAGETIASSSKGGLDGDGEVRIIGASSPRGLDIASDGKAWIADVGRSRVYRVNSAGSTVDSTGVGGAMDIAIDATRGEAYVSQYTLRTIKVLNLSNGRAKGVLSPPAADLKLDLDGETGTGALSGIDVGSCQRVYVANEQGRSLLAGNPLDSPFSNVGDDNNVKAADTDPVLVVTGNVVAKESEGEESEVASDQLAVTSYQLEQNYPNPFWSEAASRTTGNPSTVISFALPEAGKVSITIYSITGQLVRELVNGEMVAGRHAISWDGRNQLGNVVAAGVYFYRMTVAGKNGEMAFSKAQRMTMVK